MQAAVTLLAYCAVAILIIAAVGMLAAVVWVAGNALAALARARSYEAQAIGSEETLQRLNDAAEEVRRAKAQYVPPTEEELLEQIVSERASGNGQTNREYDTNTNAGIPDEDQQPMATGTGEYRI